MLCELLGARLTDVFCSVPAEELLLAQCKYIYGDGLPDTSQTLSTRDLEVVRRRP